MDETTVEVDVEEDNRIGPKLPDLVSGDQTIFFSVSTAGEDDFDLDGSLFPSCADFRKLR